MGKTLRANIKELLKVTFPTGVFKYSATQPMMSRVADIQSICPFEGWFKLISTEIYTTRIGTNSSPKYLHGEPSTERRGNIHISLTPAIRGEAPLPHFLIARDEE